MDAAITAATLRGRIGTATLSAANAAVIEVGIGVDFATVGIIQITVVERRITAGYFADAVGTYRRSVCDRAALTTGVTIIDVVAGVDFATVGVGEVTVLPRRGAARNSADTARTNRRTISDAARDGATSASVYVGV